MRILFLIVSLILPSSLIAQHKFLTLESCLEYAYEHRNELQISKLNQQIAKNNSKIAQGTLLPQVKAFTTLDDNVQLPVQLIPAEFVGGQAGEFAEIQFGTQYNFAAGLEASVPIWNANLWNKLKISYLNEEKAYQQHLQQKLQIAEQLSQLYYNCLLLKEIETINQQNFQNDDSLFKSSKHQFEAGTIELLDLNRIKALWLKSQQNLVQANANYQKQLDQLKVALGISLEETIELPLPNEFNNAISNTAPSYTVEAYPLFKQFKLDQDIANIQLKNQKQSRLPQVSAYARYTAQAQRNQFDFLDMNQPWFGIGVIGLRADIPIFSGLQKKNGIQKANLQLEVANLGIQKFQQEQTQKDRALMLDYQTAQKQYISSQQVYDLAKKNYDLAQIKYENGVFTLDQLINIHNEQLNAQNQYMNQLGLFLIRKALIQVKNQLLTNP